MNDNSENKGWVGIQNWLGKLVLFLAGSIWFVASLYPHILKGFFLTDREVPAWGSISDLLVLFAQSGLVLGGWYLNAVIDFLKSKFSK